MTVHVERGTKTGGARKHAEIREGLRDHLIRDAGDRKQADGQPARLMNDRLTSQLSRRRMGTTHARIDPHTALVTSRSFKIPRE